MMSGKDEAAIPVGVAPSSPARARVSEDISPASPQWQQGTAVRMLPEKPIVKKPRVPKIWIIFAVIGLLLLLAPSIVTFLINLGPGDHSDNGDGQYWLPGLLLIPCMFFGPLAIFLAYCIGIVEWVMWVREAHRQRAESTRMYVVPPVIMIVGYILVRLSIFALASLDI